VSKRASSQGAHIEQRHGRWYVVLENKDNGKRRRKWLGRDDGRGFVKKGGALALLAKVVHEKRSGTYIAPATQTVGEYLADLARGREAEP
jgi:hypothetical protein